MRKEKIERIPQKQEQELVFNFALVPGTGGTTIIPNVVTYASTLRPLDLLEYVETENLLFTCARQKRTEARNAGGKHPILDTIKEIILS